MIQSTATIESTETIRPARHFLVVAVPFLRQGNDLYMELQALDGLQRWVNNFGSMILAAPTANAEYIANYPGIAWAPANALSASVQFVPLPMAYRVKEFARVFRATRARLAACIDNAELLQFGIGCLVGDWGGVASEIAISKGRKFAVHMDRVEHRVVIETARNQPFIRRAKVRVQSVLMRRWFHRLISRANLALFNGQECMDAYGGLSPASYRIYDVHVDVQAAVIDTITARKRREIESGAPLKICYSGRLDVEKAPLDWLRAIAHARDRGVRIEATWLGDGPLRAKCLSLIEELGLQSCVSLPGFVKERQEVMDVIASSHAMMFTHVTPESPRCLVEALMHATPILGYESVYSKELLQESGGGMHVKNGNFEQLGELLVQLDHDRPRLIELMESARVTGRRFGAQEVFRARSELIVKHLGNEKAAA